METMRKHRRIKSFDELTITDDFMFGAVMSDPKRCTLSNLTRNGGVDI